MRAQPFESASNNCDETLRSWYEELLGNKVKFKGRNSICSTCKHFNGKTCSKGYSFAGFATKLSDCNDDWEICNTGYDKGDN